MRRPIAVLTVLLAALVLPTGAFAQQATTTSAPTLAVVGQGIAFVTPDTADVSASVTKTSTSAGIVREDVARRTTALLNALAALGVPRTDITTTSVSVRRETFRKRPKVRYTATSSLGIHLVDAALAGPVLDALVAASADDVEGPSFGFSGPSAGAAEAEAAALADARARANAAAAAVGMRVVGVQAIDLDPGSGLGLPSRESADAAAPSPKGATATPVQAGRQQVTASVAVVFILA